MAPGASRVAGRDPISQAGQVHLELPREARIRLSRWRLTQSNRGQTQKSSLEGRQAALRKLPVKLLHQLIGAASIKLVA
jgi:hypothetical protein